MSRSSAQRFYAIALSALLTLATLGGIDRLATHPAEGGQWAQHRAAPRA